MESIESKADGKTRLLFVISVHLNCQIDPFETFGVNSVEIRASKFLANSSIESHLCNFHWGNIFLLDFFFALI